MSDAAPSREEIQARLRDVGGRDDAAIDLGETALWLAALDRPNVALDRYRAHLADLAATLPGGTPGADDMAAALCDMLVRANGYAGDQQNYDDDQNANLIRVIDRRKGLPVSLGILMIDAGTRAGWTIHGLSFPYHFLVRVDHGNTRAVLDPFNGTPLTPADMRTLLKSFNAEADLEPALYQPVGRRDVLVRLQNNLKSRAVQLRRFDRAAELVEHILMFAPDLPPLWRELGILKVACGLVNEAMTAAEHYQEVAENDAQRHDAAKLVQKIKSHLN